MEEGSVNESVPDLKDLEQKIGRKTPEGLLKWMREDASHRGDGILKPQEGKDLDLGRKGLAEKIRDLKMEMMDMRGDRRCRWSREMEREPSFLPSVKAEGQTERWCLFLEDSAQPVYTISLHCGLDGAVLWKRSSLNIGGKVSLSSRSTADRPVLLSKQHLSKYSSKRRTHQLTQQEPAKEASLMRVCIRILCDSLCCEFMVWVRCWSRENDDAEGKSRYANLQG
ncbi:hypothetical protein JZ751_024811 [Albula glossodonta]|uniref:Uncharacterized protein n=1 Tax=Albula glossodonta TaxID=121402 RepID=A0A8T2PLQ6_9TELE|nr:hypothetical protein JZ751_024811 [Albula glossodonta]